MAESAEPTPGPNASESREAVQNVLEELETPPALAVGDITERVDYSRRTVHSRLKDLKEDPMVDLKSAKIGGSTAYWIPEPEGTTGSWGAGFAGAATAQVATFRSWVTPAFAISPALVAWLFVSFIPTWLLAVGAASWFAGVTPTRIKDRRFGRPEKTALLWSGVATASVGFVYILLEQLTIGTVNFIPDVNPHVYITKWLTLAFIAVFAFGLISYAISRAGGLKVEFSATLGQ